MIERAVVLSRGPLLEFGPELLSHAVAPQDYLQTTARVLGPGRADAITLEENERRHIEEMLERTSWVIEGERGAAAALGLSASTLRSRMKKLGVRRPRR